MIDTKTLNMNPTTTLGRVCLGAMTVIVQF